VYRKDRIWRIQGNFFDITKNSEKCGKSWNDFNKFGSKKAVSWIICVKEDFKEIGSNRPRRFEKWGSGRESQCGNNVQRWIYAGIDRDLVPIVFRTLNFTSNTCY